MKFNHFMLPASLICTAVCALLVSLNATAQDNSYTAPSDPAVLQKLDEWQDLKFGVIFHWGIYAVPGIMESWSLCSEDEEWIYDERVKRNMSIDEFRTWYWSLSEAFNPTLFDPAGWADIMKDAGMKYFVFTTKHHDGFCMFDTKYTDYKITNGPFGDDPRSNVTKEVFNSFRDKGFMVGCYFSKPDWHCPYYWSPLFDAPDRMYNYDVNKHPDIFRKYIEYTQGQLEELTSDYGKIDILWLDGGQVDGSEIGLDEVLVGARERNPGLICVDRARRNHNENYQTPEWVIPERQQNIPWETCEALRSWSWRPDMQFKTAVKVISNLIEIVAKGGNYLLGVGPTPLGEIDATTQGILSEVGIWLRKYGKAIYNTRITGNYHCDRVWFNADKDGRTLYALYSYQDGDGELPATIEWTGNIPSGKMTLVSNGKAVKYKVSGDRVTVNVPKGLPAESFALEFTME